LGNELDQNLLVAVFDVFTAPDLTKLSCGYSKNVQDLVTDKKLASFDSVVKLHCSSW